MVEKHHLIFAKILLILTLAAKLKLLFGWCKYFIANF